MLTMKLFLQLITSIAPTLPEGDVSAIQKGPSYNVVDRQGNRVTKAGLHQELEAARAEGKWIPKVDLLPDVSAFSIALNTFNPALLAHGLVARYPSELSLTTNRNRKANRYLLYSYVRLLRAQPDPNRYWLLSKLLVARSNVYLTLAIHGINKNLYREISQRDYYRLLIRVNTMRAHLNYLQTYVPASVGAPLSKFGMTFMNPLGMMRHYIAFFRVYIPKGEKWRPLGVPTLAWRILLRMWVMPFVGFTAHNISKEFHGFLPSRGTGTAWKSILEKVIHSPNIFEIDFQGFFPSVPTDMLSHILLNVLHIPLDQVLYVHQMHQSKPLFLQTKEFDKLQGEVRWSPAHQESLRSDAAKCLAVRPLPKFSNCKKVGSQLLTMRMRKGSQLYLNSWEQQHQVELSLRHQAGKPSMYQALPDAAAMGAWTFAQTAQPFEPHEAKEARKVLGEKFWGNIGLPQGSPLSPFLSILYLDCVFKELEIPDGVNWIFYADDGLFYSEDYKLLSTWISKVFNLDKRDSRTFTYWNIILAAHKSAWVKINGEWLKPLKFLGLILVPGPTLADHKLIAQTRSGGSKLEFDKYDLLRWSWFSNLSYNGHRFGALHRLRILKKFKSNPRTQIFISLYETLATIPLERFAGIEYLYLLYNLSLTSMFKFAMFFLTGAYDLRDSRKLQRFLDVTQEENFDVQVKAYQEFNSFDRSLIEQFIRSSYSFEYRDSSKSMFSTSELLVKELERFPLIVDNISNPLPSKYLNNEGHLELVVVIFITTVILLHPYLSSFTTLALAFLLTGVIILFEFDSPSGPKVVFERLSPWNSSVQERLRMLFSASYSFLGKVGTTFPVRIRVPGGTDYFDKELSLQNFFSTSLLKFFYWVSSRRMDLTDPDSRRGASFESRLLYSYFRRHAMKNLARSPYFGLIQSRLYTGSWTTESIVQDFSFTSFPDSLGEMMLESENGRSINIFVGSSYACRFTLGLLGTLSTTSSRRKYSLRQALGEIS